MSDLFELGVGELLVGYARREFTPPEVVSACLEQIAAVDEQVGAVETLCAEEAMEAARLSQQRWRAGTAAALEGVPFGLKDNIATKGVRTTYGSARYSTHVPLHHAAVARRLLDAGAVLVAKLSTYEFAAGRNSRVHNPWDLSRSPGGSSSGPAAAVAARELPLAVGTDTGGSIRVPASWCGVVGLKPTEDLVPADGVAPLSWSLDHVGPIARSAADAASALSVMAGWDRDGDGTGDPEHGAARSASGVSGIRLGVPSNWFFEHCTNEVAECVHGAIDDLASVFGMSLRPITLPLAQRINPDSLKHVIVMAEAASAHESNLRRLDEYGEVFGDQVVEGRLIRAVDYLRALRIRSLLRDELSEVFAEVDAIVAPTVGIVAPGLSDATVEVDGRELELKEVVALKTSIFNLTGTPAVTEPCGLDGSGLPIGLQIATPRAEDRLCLRLATAFESTCDPSRFLPDLLRTS